MKTACSQAVARTFSVRGVEPVGVEVQVDISPGIPAFIIVGLADTAVMEARDRVRSALKAAGYRLPAARVTVNLAPAPLRKHGTGFDLPIAVAILAASGQAPRDTLDGRCFAGELSLDGGVRHVSGLLAHALAAHEESLVLVGPPSVAPAAATAQARCAVLRRMADLAHLSEVTPSIPSARARSTQLDFADVAGHESAKRALQVAATGAHHVLMVGPPGSGKSMLAARLPSILPPLESRQRREAALVHSVAGLDVAPILQGYRPFRAPHHSATMAGLCGGGVPPSPGEASLAHHGVLFLDEVPQFGPSALQALRQPLEDRTIRLVRADGVYVFPAAFTLVAAANPCPCGHHGDDRHQCRCIPADIDRYQCRVGGPLLDRLDIRVRVDAQPATHMLAQRRSIGSQEMLDTVRHARAFAKTHDDVGGLVGGRLATAAKLDTGARHTLAHVAQLSGLSGRGITRLIRVARSIADLEAREVVTQDHIDEAHALRGPDGAAMPL
jgi:magnesium chelatase family protein